VWETKRCSGSGALVVAAEAHMDTARAACCSRGCSPRTRTTRIVRFFVARPWRKKIRPLRAREGTAAHPRPTRGPPSQNSSTMVAWRPTPPDAVAGHDIRKPSSSNGPQPLSSFCVGRSRFVGSSGGGARSASRCRFGSGDEPCCCCCRCCCTTRSGLHAAAGGGRASGGDSAAAAEDDAACCARCHAPGAGRSTDILAIRAMARDGGEAKALCAPKRCVVSMRRTAGGVARSNASIIFGLYTS
jgi:hypothetical protein